jgi:hypothetical protein
MCFWRALVRCGRRQTLERPYLRLAWRVEHIAGLLAAGCGPARLYLRSNCYRGLVPAYAGPKAYLPEVRAHACEFLARVDLSKQ